ncbi:hypothetical protein Ssi03_12160 [Sphaerisporangium siamense]|nr:hypothetical protein Ssi03_12160 [Sphaerisporangium siamense]
MRITGLQLFASPAGPEPFFPSDLPPQALSVRASLPVSPFRPSVPPREPFPSERSIYFSGGRTHCRRLRHAVAGVPGDDLAALLYNVDFWDKRGDRPV